MHLAPSYPKSILDGLSDPYHFSREAGTGPGPLGENASQRFLLNCHARVYRPHQFNAQMQHDAKASSIIRGSSRCRNEGNTGNSRRRFISVGNFAGAVRKHGLNRSGNQRGFERNVGSLEAALHPVSSTRQGSARSRLCEKSGRRIDGVVRGTLQRLGEFVAEKSRVLGWTATASPHAQADAFRRRGICPPIP